MKTLYIECSMGAAGDMLTAALFELLDDKESFIKKLNTVGIEGFMAEPEPMNKCGILGTHMRVLVNGVTEEEGGQAKGHAEHTHRHGHGQDGHGHDHHDHDHEHEHDHDHHHTTLSDIEEVIDGLKVSDKVRTDIKNVYKLLAGAESAVHGVPVTEIHFHEVGTKDAIADITAVCMLMDEIGADCVMASPVHVGNGHVHCAHGVLPVPAPATAFLLRGIPFYTGKIQSELCTPTGAALLKYFVSSFGNMPVMTVDKTGYGMGRKDFEQANCVRAFLGTTRDNSGEIVELTCNIDDMTAERIAFATETFFEAGALEAYTIPIGMKKSRPGILLCVICDRSLEEKMIALIFKHTTTLGIRENISRRFTLKREIITKDTEFGEVRIKRSEGFGVVREKLEYEDLARIAREKGLSVEEVASAITRE